MRRRALAAGGLASVALVAGGLAWTSRTDGSDDAAAAGTGAGHRATAEVTRRDLEERAEVDGTLGYGDATEITLGSGGSGDPDDTTSPGSPDGGGSGGTITGLPDVGTVVQPGETLLEVDGEPVPLLGGERPLWRTLGPGVEDGPDVLQLEYNLVALGVVTTAELSVDEDWTGATTAAVEEWQESLGSEVTGTVAPGDLVFMPGAVRVVGHPTAVGGSASGAVLEVSGTTREVTVDLAATRQTLVERDQQVEVELPDGSTLAGVVTDVGTVADVPGDGGDGDAPGGQGDGGEATIEVTVALDDPSQVGGFDEAPVSVHVVTSTAEDVLAVPVHALLALAEGGYAVERVTGDGATGGATELVAVELGADADGWVEVTGDLAEGDEVVVPE